MPIAKLIALLANVLHEKGDPDMEVRIAFLERVAGTDNNGLPLPDPSWEERGTTSIRCVEIRNEGKPVVVLTDKEAVE